jgi:hypothetical protein
MTHPLHDARAGSSKPRQKPNKGEPFDPVELSRKLNAHITEQKIKAEQRRVSRAAKGALEENCGGYRHVPKVAAAAFERTTTTVDSKDKMHRFSKTALKTQMELLRKDEPIPIKAVTVRPLQHTVSIKKHEALDKARTSRDLIANGGRYQWSHDVEEASEQDSNLERYNPRRNFNDELAHLKGTHRKNVQSVGDLCWDELESSTMPFNKPQPMREEVPAYTAHDRPDWLEREDSVIVQKKKNRASPILKRMESSWLLISKKEKKHDEAIAGLDSPEDKGTTTFTSRKFLARFKRQTSSS